MSGKDPVFERSRCVEDLQHLRLMALLDEMVRYRGIMRAAQEWRELKETHPNRAGAWAGCGRKNGSRRWNWRCWKSTG